MDNILEKLKNKKGVIIFFLFVLFAVVGLYNSWKDQASLNSNKKITIGKVTDFRSSTRGSGYIVFQFYVDGKLYQTKDPYKGGWPKYIRNARPEKYKHYPVEYDAKNPNNSKILITNEPIGIEKLLKNGLKIKGEVEHIFTISDTYVDLHINYNYFQGNFKFRTRLHQDSLPCGTVDDCQKSKIDLVISKDFPIINNLYYQSYDRKAMIKAKEKRAKEN